jgi:hypothetical protein
VASRRPVASRRKVTPPAGSAFGALRLTSSAGGNDTLGLSATSPSANRENVTQVLALGLLVLLLSTGRGSPETREGATEVHKNRGFALFRLPGRAGQSCLGCHDQGSLPPSPEPDRLRDHVSGQLGELSAQDLGHLQRYLDELRREAATSTQVDREELVESMRALGYVNFRTGKALPLLRDGMRLNAFELSRSATGSTRLVSAARSPTGQALELRDGNLAGLVLPQTGADAGTYVLTLRATATLPEGPFRMLLTGRDRPRSAVPMERASTPTEATASFQIERAVPLTIAIVPTRPEPIGIAELIITRN